MHPVPARATTRARMMPSRRRPAYRQQAYTQVATVPLQQTGQALVSGAGIAQVAIGPAGTGTKWYPTTATFSTTTGPSDTSLVILYAGYVSVSTLLDGNTYAGGGSSAGLSVPLMMPGDLVVAEWVNAHPGDVAQLTIIGSRDTLVIP